MPTIQHSATKVDARRIAHQSSVTGQLAVCRDRAFEIVVLLARNEAEVFRRSQHLLSLRWLAKHPLGLAEMFVRAAVPRV